MAKQGEVYSYKEMNFFILTIDDPGLPTGEKDNEPIHYDVDEEEEERSPREYSYSAGDGI